MDVALLVSYVSLGFLVVPTLVLVFFWKDYYFIYNHRLLFVVGLEFSRYLTDYAIISVLIWYFTNYGTDLAMSAILTNIQGSLSSLLVIFMAHAANSYVGRFCTLLFSNTAYICGLMLLWLFNPLDVKWLLVISIVLLSLGTSCGNILQDVLKDLVHGMDKSPDKNKRRSLARAKIWSRVAYASGAISAILWVATDAVGGVHPSWQSTFLICIIIMTTSLIIFCTGHNIYHQGPLIERPAKIFFRVSSVYIKKLLNFISRCFMKFSRQDRPPENLETEKIGNDKIPHHERPPRSLNTKGIRSVSNYEQKQEDMVVVKRLLRMVPMWALFFVVSLISATGFTFFLQQYNKLIMSDKIPVQIYNFVQDLSRFAIPFLYRWICSCKSEKIKIGVGMLCGIISCIFAWQLEVYRLKEVQLLFDVDSNTSISFLWLVPQFCLLGFMEGLTGEGLLKFYESQMKEEPQLISYGEEYIEIVMGLGMLINIFLILVFKSRSGWFGDTINNSRLDKYYLVLVYVSSANFILYCLIARYFYKDQYFANDDQVLANDGHEKDNKLLASGNQKQDKQVLANECPEKYDKLSAGSDNQKQDNQVLANDEQKQDNQDVLAR